jgi:hypothetical protein
VTSKEEKLRAKRTKKRKELTELFKRGKITTEQYAAGLRKLGYSTDIEKAAAFKKYIREQIKAFEEMKVDQAGDGSGYYFDPNESRTDLPRDEFGNVIYDFSVSGQEKTEMKRATEDVPSVDHGLIRRDSRQGPVFGQGIFGERSSRKERRRAERKERPRIYDESEKGPAKRSMRRIRALADWDEDEGEPDVIKTETVLELEEEGESGWWDDSDWVLEWTEEDEEEYDDWVVEIEEDDEEEWILEFEDDEMDGEFEVIFEEEEISEVKDDLSPKSKDYVVSFEEEDEDPDIWKPSSNKRRRKGGNR